MLNSNQLDESGPSKSALIRIDLAGHCIALVSCIVGGIILGSISLLAIATNHLASIGFRLTASDKRGSLFHTQTFRLAIARGGAWVICALLCLYIVTAGSHRIFHFRILEAGVIIYFIFPSIASIAITAVTAYRNKWPRFPIASLEVILAFVPIVSVLWLSIADLPATPGLLDAAIGLISVIILCIRGAMYLPRALAESEK